MAPGIALDATEVKKVKKAKGGAEDIKAKKKKVRKSLGLDDAFEAMDTIEALNAPPAGKDSAKKEKKEKKEKSEKKKRKLETVDAPVDSPAKEKKAKKPKVVVEEPVRSKVQTDEPQEEAGPLSVEAFRKKHDIRVSGMNVPQPCQHFADVQFPDVVQRSLLAAGFDAPSAIQAQAWPVALRGSDCLAIAKTGSGKTCGYLLPTIAHILKMSMPERKSKVDNVNGPIGLVLAPTRELAIQIEAESGKFGQAAGIRSCCLYGGASKGPQIRDIKYGVDIVIATPGRLLDMATLVCRFDNSKILTLAKVEVLILDEADRMLDMGFEKDIRSVIAQVKKQRQTLFFTATWPKAVQRIAGEILKPDRVQINIGDCNALTANKDVNQIVKVIDHRTKGDELKAILDAAGPEDRVIVFCNRKCDVYDIENNIWQAGGRVGSIHGDKTQEEREWTLNEFKKGNAPIMVATDVAARGLDIKGVEIVVNYDFPGQTEDYIHRIGRTGRAGAKGTAYTFFTNIDKGKAFQLVKILKEANQEVPATLEAMAARGGFGGGGRGGGRGGGGWRGGGRGGGGGRGRGGGGRGGRGGRGRY